MIISNKKMESILGNAELAVSNALENEELKTMLMEYNYDDQRLNEGLSLQQKAKELYQTYAKEHGQQLEATSQLEEIFEECNSLYIEHITLSRLALRNEPSKKSKFALDGERKNDMFGWIEQAELFYDNCLADEELLNKLLRYNLSGEKLEKGRQSVLNVKKANQTQEKEKSESQEARRQRDEAFTLLSDWMTEFNTVARFACSAKPELLEKLGIFVKSD
jgi:hypothetical protein